MTITKPLLKNISKSKKNLIFQQKKIQKKNGRRTKNGISFSKLR